MHGYSSLSSIGKAAPMKYLNGHRHRFLLAFLVLATSVQAATADIDSNSLAEVSRSRTGVVEHIRVLKRGLPDRGTTLGTALNKLNLTGNGVEIGVQRGQHAFELMQTWQGQKLVLVDAWMEQAKILYRDGANVPQEMHDANMRHAISLLESYSHRVEFLREWSLEAAKLFPSSHFDLIYIDARHDYDGVLEDLHAWWPKLREGGMFSGHDYWDGEYQGNVFGVQSAVNTFAALLNRSVQCMGCGFPGPSWYFFK